MNSASVENFPKYFKDFQLVNLNHLIEKEPSHLILHLKPNEKNLELKIIILEEVEKIKTKKLSTISKFLVADWTGCMFANFFDVEEGDISPGDVYYLSGAYTSMHKNQLILYEGKQGLLMKIGYFFFKFNDSKNISLFDWSTMVKD